MGSSNPVAKAQDIANNAIDRGKNAASSVNEGVNKAIESDRGRKGLAAALPYTYLVNNAFAQGALARARGDSVQQGIEKGAQPTIGAAQDATGSDLGLGPDIPADPTAPLDDSTKTPNGRRKRTLDNRAGTILTGGGGTSGTLGDASGGQRSNLLGL